MTNQIYHIQIKKKVNDITEVIATQLLLYCFEKGIWLNKSEFDTLLYISCNGYNKVSTLKEIVQKGIFKSEQCVRNTRNKLVKYGLLIEKNKRDFDISPLINIKNKGRILLDFKKINLNET